MMHTNIGRLAVEKKWLTEEQLQQSVEIMDKTEGQESIEQVLFNHKLLSKDQIINLQKRRKVNIKKIENQAMVDYIVKMKVVPREKLKNCLNIQQRALEQKTFIPIDQLVVSHGLVQQARINEIKEAREIRRYIQQAVSSDDPSRKGLINRVLGGYQLISEIASGGMGIVYRAVQLELERTIALKILFDQFARKKKHLNQFYREARLSAALNHPNLVHIFEVGNDQGFYYYSMELVEGVNLGDRLLEEQKLSQEDALDIITQAGQGLEHIHSFDIVHRDIKPSNFIIRHDGIVKIMDLGLARQLSKLQKKASTMGTPYYMSPELIHNPQEANQRADIYALGVSFYRLLTGEYPITGNDAKEILKNINEQIPIPVTQVVPEVSPEIEKIIDKMIAKDPNERYQNMTAVLNDLDRVLII
ncbi:serine/threonine protein kinase [Candidatus Uabimicrobium amorphum]|uniref:Serine/threonine protein kinase n=1 Tax=Uabimicrobium amorphum TaxID=2596890 RepID=A0A5S9F722_UABAM|nr:serine/threonine-protein kinase [Candidatus Uabimicrobium amorphum]BBM87931.1 serine/threonine protein kinase [Candidatus Uabimicrobium amorphum]